MLGTSLGTLRIDILLIGGGSINFLTDRKAKKENIIEFLTVLTQKKKYNFCSNLLLKLYTNVTPNCEKSTRKWRILIFVKIG